MFWVGFLNPVGSFPWCYFMQQELMRVTQRTLVIPSEKRRKGWGEEKNKKSMYVIGILSLKGEVYLRGIKRSRDRTVVMNTTRNAPRKPSPFHSSSTSLSYKASLCFLRTPCAGVHDLIISLHINADQTKLALEQ